MTSSTQTTFPTGTAIELSNGRVRFTLAGQTYETDRATMDELVAVMYRGLKTGAVEIVDAH